MRNIKLAVALTLVSALAAPSFAAYSPDFDNGVSVSRAIEAAIESAASAGGLIPAPPPPVRGDTVWVTMEKGDVSALDDTIFKSAPVAQNDRLVVYEFLQDELGRIGDGMLRTFGREPGYIAHSTLADALAELKAPAQVPVRSYSVDQADRVKKLMGLVKEEPIVAVIKSLSAFKNRYYRSATGIDASKWLQQLWGEFAASRSDISVEAFKHSYPQESVILTMTGAVEPEKVVVIGGHLDSTAGYWGGETAVAPGADDNASGVAVTHEIIRALVEGGYRPAKTIKFIAFAAEEVGLRGSGDIAAAFQQEGVQVEGMLNLDMVNYKGSEGDIYFVTDYTSEAQNAFVGSLIDSYTDYTWGSFPCGYGCSDHASWTKRGYPASTPFESTKAQMNPYIHKSADTLDKTDGRAEHAFKFARVGVAYAVELAK